MKAVFHFRRKFFFVGELELSKKSRLDSTFSLVFIVHMQNRIQKEKYLNELGASLGLLRLFPIHQILHFDDRLDSVVQGV